MPRGGSEDLWPCVPSGTWEGLSWCPVPCEGQPKPQGTVTPIFRPGLLVKAASGALPSSGSTRNPASLYRRPIGG
uniref:Uncharacterized protein n=1 Tax=Anguilla anguilla TaxID=7936 RepID=A0A0E9S9W7_ANGAN